MKPNQAHGQLSVGFILCFASSFAFGQPGQVFPSVSLHSDKIQLSGSIQLSLALEGPAPLRLELPKDAEKLLAPESATVWHIKSLGPAKVTPVEGGRERWEQKFRLSPFVHGEKVPIAFATIKVNSEDVTFPTKEVRVQTSIAEAKADNARPVTGIEELPTIEPPQPETTGWQFMAVLGGIFAVVLIGAIIRRSRAKPPPVPPGEWAGRELDRLERDRALERISSLVAAERLAAILREFIEIRHGLSATKLTTAELLAECAKANWSADRTAPLAEILERCDRAKFAGDAPDAERILAMVNRAREWVVAQLREGEAPAEP